MPSSVPTPRPVGLIDPSSECADVLFAKHGNAWRSAPSCDGCHLRKLAIGVSAKALRTQELSSTVEGVDMAPLDGGKASTKPQLVLPALLELPIGGAPIGEDCASKASLSGLVTCLNERLDHGASICVDVFLVPARFIMKVKGDMAG